MAHVDKRTILIALAMIFALVLCAAPAYAYFTKWVEASGDKQIMLEYSGEVEEEVDDLEKKISMKNTGESDIMVEVRIVGAKSTEFVDISVKGSAPWECISEPGTNDQVWAYNDVVPAGESTDPENPLTVAIENIKKEGGHDFDILVEGRYYPVYYDHGTPKPYKTTLKDSE